MKNTLLLIVLFLNSLFCFSQLNIDRIEFRSKINNQLLLREFEVRNLQINIKDTTLSIGEIDPIIFTKVSNFFQTKINGKRVESYVYRNSESKLCQISFWVDGKSAENQIVIMQSISNWLMIYHIKMFVL